jgi:hypothetical protein
LWWLGGCEGSDGVTLALTPDQWHGYSVDDVVDIMVTSPARSTTNTVAPMAIAQDGGEAVKK